MYRVSVYRFWVRWVSPHPCALPGYPCIRVFLSWVGVWLYRCVFNFWEVLFGVCRSASWVSRNHSSMSFLGHLEALLNFAKHRSCLIQDSFCPSRCYPIFFFKQVCCSDPSCCLSYFFQAERRLLLAPLLTISLGNPGWGLPALC